jgi:anti-sigma factor ChrR (cupin superfamily)
MNYLMVNADWSQRCVVDSNTEAWQPSPAALVHRRVLERNGAELARATSIVRYDAGAKFHSHEHTLGEEILVLDGTLSDEFGDYGPGTYLKNSSGSQMGRIDGDRIYDGSGHQIGRADGLRRMQIIVYFYFFM